MFTNNPVLKGFHPDPSIIRVDDDYYIATSTFEWWPGISIHHSRDLVNWQLLTYPLNRVSQLDLRGVGASQGIWAPCLTYDQGIYYLVYTVVRSNRTTAGVVCCHRYFPGRSPHIQTEWLLLFAFC